jgi:hypothetical protein
MSRIVYVHDCHFLGAKISMILTPCHTKKLQFELISQRTMIDHRWHGGFLVSIFNAIQGKYPNRL